VNGAMYLLNESEYLFIFQKNKAINSLNDGGHLHSAALSYFCTYLDCGQIGPNFVLLVF
jgi:hypothetical protein